MNGLIARVRSFWRGLRRPAQLEAEMDEEMRFHVEMEAERLVRERRLGADEARRQAAVAFGGREKFKEEGRDARGLTGITGLSLDLKLARRMLAKSPGLTLVGGLGMAVAIAVGAGHFIFVHAMISPSVPLEEGDRIVALANRDVRANGEERQLLHDFATWRGGMRSVVGISALRMVDREVIGGDALPAVLPVAEMTASAFQAARVPPLLGRYVVEEDERAGAPRVVVIGHDVWQSRFGGDRGVLGREILLGDTAHTVVGVMPPGYAFPMDHSVWTAFRIDPARHGPGEGPEIVVFGRLAPGVSMQQARDELAAIGRRAAAAHPATHAHLRPRVMPYTYPLDGIPEAADGIGFAILYQFFVTLLLVGVAVNVAVLIYARTAMRRGEIAVRSALGASRRRIVMQLFVEALLLAMGAAAVGLVIAHFALRQVKLQMEQVMLVGFWVDLGVKPATVLMTAGLALLAAVIVGVVPALQFTGRQLQADLRRLGGGSGRGMGRTWTVLIVAQVAMAVAVLPAAVNMGWQQIRSIAVRPTFPADEFLMAGVGLSMDLRPGMDGEAYRRESAARFGDRLTELLRRLEAEPAVAGATFNANLPGRGNVVMAEGVAAPPRTPEGHNVFARGIGPGYLDLFGARTLTGRGFHSGDLRDSANTVIVSRAFVRQILGDREALGQRVRFVPMPGGTRPEEGKPDTWYEIVGVVEDLRANPLEPGRVPPHVYYPVAPGQVQSATALVRVRGDAESFAPRLREIATTLDPALRVNVVRSLANVERPPVLRLIEAAMFLVVTSVLLLSAAGIHALMSFTVTQRRKEIGIRTALGARPRRLLASIFSRALWQLALGATISCILGGALLRDGRTGTGRAAFFLVLITVLVLLAGLLATLGPARRGLRIQPMDALREE